MKNILNIIRHDSKKITGSVVAIITVMGLCIVPCLYAWFNIFSNWAPYDSDATGRISVAVANMDEGGDAAGLKLNVGDKIIEALEANGDIGWVFVDSSKEAIDGVYAGDYYAALVVPEDFTGDVLSFMSGRLINPRMYYYENEKKNAIAPKITGKAKTAVQEQVNATFVETLASYVSDAASIAEANGADPEDILNDLSDKVDALGRDMNSCIVLSNSAAGLTDAAGDLMDVSDTLIGSTQDVLTANDLLLEDAESRFRVSRLDASTRDSASRSARNARGSLEELKKAADALASGTIAFDIFVVTDKPAWMERAQRLQKDAAAMADTMTKAGHTVLASKFADLANKFGDIYEDLNSLDTSMSEEQRTAALEKLAKDITDAFTLLDDIEAQISEDISAGLEGAIADARNSVSSFRTSLAKANSDLGKVSRLMGRYGDALGDLGASVDKTTATIKELQRGTGTVSDMLSDAAGNELLKSISGLLANDETAVAEYLANPIKMDTRVLWKIENYGSAMAPFYTVLAQWVGALLTAVIIKVKIKKRRDLVDLRLHEWYFGRFGLYMLVGTAQALIVSLGDLLYVGIQCVSPGRFVLLAWIDGMAFMMINYALVFALDNIGLGAGVIVLVLQVAGSGGTYPVEVLPEPFKAIYPFMPFRYAMDGMRECIGGMYDGTYWRCVGVLGIFFIFATAFGLAMYRPALWLNNLIAESKAKSEIML